MSRYLFYLLVYLWLNFSWSFSQILQNLTHVQLDILCKVLKMADYILSKCHSSIAMSKSQRSDRFSWGEMKTNQHNMHIQRTKQICMLNWMKAVQAQSSSLPHANNSLKLFFHRSYHIAMKIISPGKIMILSSITKVIELTVL